MVSTAHSVRRFVCRMSDHTYNHILVLIHIISYIPRASMSLKVAPRRHGVSYFYVTKGGWVATGLPNATPCDLSYGFLGDAPSSSIIVRPSCFVLLCSCSQVYVNVG
jgi:hypothetical protein